jgi:hypothetical protein
LFTCIGAGALNLVNWFCRERVSHRFDVFYKFWFGLVLVIAILQLISFFSAINIFVFYFISLLALTAAVLDFRSIASSIRTAYHYLFTLRGLSAVFVTLLLLVTISYSANKEIEHADTFIYHFNAVKWVKEYAVVPGLANLHGRLGFNSSFFLFAAMTEVGFYENESAHVALSFFMVMCAIHWFFLISSPQELVRKKIFCLLTFPYILTHVFFKLNITSLATDNPTAILILLFCLLILDNVKFKLLILIPLSALIMTFKLSGMIVVGIGLVLLAGYLLDIFYRTQEQRHLKYLLISVLLFFVIIAGFVGRNAVVSGWLIYPFPIGNLHLPWSVPRIFVLDMIDWIKSYPKIPGGASPATIQEHDFAYWFIPWYSNFKTLNEFTLLSMGFVFLLFSAFQLRDARKFLSTHLNLLALLLFSVLAIVFWFVSAPDVRFGSIYFYIFFTAAALILYESTNFKNIVYAFICFAFAYQVSVHLPRFSIDRPVKFFTFPYTKPLKLNRVIASPSGETPELYIYMPAEGDACGNSPLPCSPYAGGLLHNHRGIRQRDPGNLSKGFLPLK